MEKSERTEKSERKIELCQKGYLSSRNYAEFIVGRLKSGGVLGAIMRAYRKIRKYTLFTAIIRGITAVIALLEKSAILLLVFSSVFLLLPLALIPLTVLGAISIIGYFKMNGAVKSWISGAETVTVYITSESFFEKNFFWKKGKLSPKCEAVDGAKSPLFVRCAYAEAEEYTHPVIVVCRDPFLVAKWAGFNILAVKCDYFFILRRFYFKQKRVSYLVLS